MMIQVTPARLDCYAKNRGHVERYSDSFGRSGGRAPHAGTLREHFHGNENPKKELLGDVFKLSLGMLTAAMRHPERFPNWGIPPN